MHLFQRKIGCDDDLVACRWPQYGAVIADAKPYDAAMLRRAQTDGGNERPFSWNQSRFSFARHGHKHNAAAAIWDNRRYKIVAWTKLAILW
jgi:hypothetical protein